MSRGFVIILVALAAACSDDEPSVCMEPFSAPTGSIRWTDGVVRLPDRIYVYHEGDLEPVECSFEPPRPEQDAIAYSCTERQPGPATLSVLLDRQRWDTPFELEFVSCHALPLTLDLELDPAAGEPL